MKTLKLSLFFKGEDILMTKRCFVPMITYNRMGEVLKEMELAFVKGEEGAGGSSTAGIGEAAAIYVERMFTVNERLTFSPENVPPKVQEKLLEMEGEKLFEKI
jgi:hypothetical protein